MRNGVNPPPWESLELLGYPTILTSIGHGGSNLTDTHTQTGGMWGMCAHSSWEGQNTQFGTEMGYKHTYTLDAAYTHGCGVAN